VTASAEKIISLYRDRKSRQSPAVARMLDIRRHYQGEVQVPLPELDKNEQSGVANLITQGLDQMAMRVASISPSVSYPPLRPGIKASEDMARTRRLANLAWWQQNRFDRKQRKRARWLIGYAASPVVIRPDMKREIPLWHLADPLNTFAAPCYDPEDICPSDCIFAFTRPLSWLTECYPAQARALEVGRANPDEPFEVLEYIDADEHVLLVVGKPAEPKSSTPWGGPAESSGAPFVELERFANRVGRCTAVVPTRLGLDRPLGQFDGMPGLYSMQARAMALFFLSSERSIFPETWFLSRPNETVQVIQSADGRAGIPGMVKGGDFKEVSMGPPPPVAQLIDTLERNQRVTAGISPDFGGEAPTNVRTGRAGEQLLSATVDFWVQEAQQTLGAAYEEENRLAVAIAREYFGNIKKSFYVNFKGAKGPVDYLPLRDFESDHNEVQWPHAGSDANSLIIGIGQRLGLKEMSVRTAQEMDPYIDDPEREHDRVTAESLEQAFLSSLDQAVASGQIGPLEVARLYELVLTHKMTVFEAMQKLHTETQEAQANAAATASPDQGAPGGLAGGGGPAGGAGGPDPSSQPGLVAPGVQQSLGLGPQNPPGGGVPTPSPSVQHMAELMGALRPRKVA
jgi:hypothetical protein